MERTLTWIAGTLALLVAVAFPAAYYAFGRIAIDATLHTEAEINARLATRIVHNNPELWQFEVARFEELLSRRPGDGTPEWRRVLDATGQVIAASADPLQAPLAAASMPLHDSGREVGRIEIARSLRPLLSATALVAVLGLLLGLAVFAALRLLPMRSLRAAMVALVAERERAFALQRERDTAAAAARVKAEFLAVMSHEIRTPMNGVLGMTELLLASPLDERQRRFTETAHGSARALLRIIDDILDFSKIEAGRLGLERSSFSPLDVVEDIVQILAPRAHQAGLEIGVLPAAAVPELIESDAGRLRQILTNLIGNAVKFTERGEVRIELDVQREGDAGGERWWLAITVADTGIGLSAEALTRVFDPFVQADHATSRRYGGTGLGLAISRRLAEALGGRLGATSREGAGSRFTLLLPLDAAPRAPQPDIVHPPRIALIDCGSLAGRTVDFALTRLGAPVEVFADAQVGCATISAARLTAPYGLVLIGPAYSRADADALTAQIEAGGAPRPRVVQLRRLAQDVLAGPAPAASRELHVPARSAELRALLLRCRAEPARTRLATTRPPPVGLRGRRVLVVEDDAVNQMVAAAMLDSLGVVCDLAFDGAAALDKLTTADYDVVLMDCQMPGIDGYEATRRIRARERADGGRQVVIALTANVTAEDRARCIDAGMDDFLTKPLTLEALRARLHDWLAPTQPAVLQL